MEPPNKGRIGHNINLVVFVLFSVSPCIESIFGPQAVSFVERSIILLCPYLNQKVHNLLELIPHIREGRNGLTSVR